MLSISIISGLNRNFWRIFTLFLIFSLSTIVLDAQISFKGPASGSISSGFVHSTDDISGALAKYAPLKIIMHTSPKPFEESDKAESLAGSDDNYLLDPAYNNFNNTNAEDIVIFQSIDGMKLKNLIPPDPTIAVGTDHVLQMVNTDVRIMKKTGEHLITFGAHEWYDKLSTVEVIADPKVIFDHFESRWVMIWMVPNSTVSESYLVISVSDDENPMGTWFTWFLPAHVNGTTPSGNWIDYPGLGFDDKAIYITGNMFTFSGDYSYAAIRILNKTELYAGSSPGKVNWTDFWDITYPGINFTAYGIRPVRYHTAADDAYFIVTRFASSASSTIGFYKIKNPVTNPVFSGKTISTSTYEFPPDSEQPGGGEYPIDNRGVVLSHEPEYRDGIIHMAHETKYQDAAGIRYLSIDVNTEKKVTDIKFGTPEHYHLFPSASVNSDNDVLITYSRTSADEYAGAYFTIFYNSTSEMSGSVVLKEGQGPYNIVANEQNRWGDYMGAYVDPVDDKSFWVNTEYADAGNSWSTRVAAVVPEPFDNAYIVADKYSLDFSDTEAGSTGNPQAISIKNIGAENLVIDNIVFSSANFQLYDQPDYPINLSFGESVSIETLFSPAGHGYFEESVEFITNSQFSTHNKIRVSGFGYEITEVELGELYASTGRAAGSAGKVLLVDTLSGGGQPLGLESGFKTLRSLTINPITEQLWAINSELAQPDRFVRIRATDGAAYAVRNSELDLQAVTFNKEGMLEGITKSGRFYRIDPETFDTSFVKDLGITFASLAYHPVTNELYGSVAESTAKDRIYKISRTGDTTLVGNTGMGQTVEALAFDGEGKLYGAVGRENALSKLIIIDPGTGVGSEVGDVGFKGVLGLAFAHEGLVSVESDKTNIPADFVLHQNYPNPFNPSTNISFSLPLTSNVEIEVFNSLGELIEVLFKGTLNSGRHIINWDVSDKDLASGIYIYSIKADGQVGQIFNDSKKMLLIK